MNAKLHSRKTLFVCLVIVSFLQWLTYQLLTVAKLGSSAECFALAQTFVVLFVTPYLAASSLQPESRHATSAQLLSLSPIPYGRHLFRRLAISQIPLLCWIFLSIGFAVFITGVSIGKAFKMLIVLGGYSFSAGAIGMWGARVLRDNIFGTALTYFLLCILIGSAFLLMPLERYINNPQPLIQPVLHLNPIIAVLNIFDGMDVFRNPLFYERTPITNYDFAYPPWYVNSFWQLAIGGCCFLLTWQMCRTTKIASIY